MSKPRQDSPEAIIPLAVYSEHQAARVLQVSRQKLLELLPELRLDDRTWYYTPHEDRVVIGNDGCQPSNTICLRVGPDHISNIDLGEIEANVVEMLAQWSR